jgi:RND family efflux transporter MFP subunit
MSRPATLFVLIITLALTSCGADESPKTSTTETVRGLTVQAMKLETLPDEIEAPGTVASAATAQVSAQAMGTVTHVAVREGDAVRAGQLLVALDERELSARRSAALAAVEEAAAGREEVAKAVAAAQAQADLAAATFKRYSFLREQKSISPQEFDEVAAKNTAAQAQLAAAKAKQQQVEAMHARAQSEAKAAETVAGYTRVVAPFSGVVVRRSVEPGQLATPGVPLVVVEDTSRYRLEVTVDASDASRIRRGSKARVTLDAIPGQTFESTVVELEAGADPGSHTVRARVELPPSSKNDPAIRSGLFGRAWFARGEIRALALPESAILHRGQLHAVYVLDGEGVARFRLITLGRAIGNPFDPAQGRRVEVLSGLGDGERVVLDPGSRELDGKKVEK